MSSKRNLAQEIIINYVLFFLMRKGTIFFVFDIV